MASLLPAYSKITDKTDKKSILEENILPWHWKAKLTTMLSERIDKEFFKGNCGKLLQIICDHLFAKSRSNSNNAKQIYTVVLALAQFEKVQENATAYQQFVMACLDDKNPLRLALLDNEIELNLQPYIVMMDLNLEVQSHSEYSINKKEFMKCLNLTRFIRRHTDKVFKNNNHSSEMKIIRDELSPYSNYSPDLLYPSFGSLVLMLRNDKYPLTRVLKSCHFEFDNAIALAVQINQDLGLNKSLNQEEVFSPNFLCLQGKCEDISGLTHLRKILIHEWEGTDYTPFLARLKGFGVPIKISDELSPEEKALREFEKKANEEHKKWREVKSITKAIFAAHDFSDHNNPIHYEQIDRIYKWSNSHDDLSEELSILLLGFKKIWWVQNRIGKSLQEYIVKLGFSVICSLDDAIVFDPSFQRAAELLFYGKEVLSNFQKGLLLGYRELDARNTLEPGEDKKKSMEFLKIQLGEELFNKLFMPNSHCGFEKATWSDFLEAHPTPFTVTPILQASELNRSRTHTHSTPV